MAVSRVTRRVANKTDVYSLQEVSEHASTKSGCSADCGRRRIVADQEVYPHGFRHQGIINVVVVVAVGIWALQVVGLW